MQGVRLMGGMLMKQAALLSYVDIFRWSAVPAAACALLSFALKKAKTSGPVVLH
jgi:hypothetical protein